MHCHNVTSDNRDEDGPQTLSLKISKMQTDRQIWIPWYRMNQPRRASAQAR